MCATVSLEECVQASFLAVCNHHTSISSDLQQYCMLGEKKWPLRSLIKSPSSLPLALPFHLMTTSRTSGRGEATTGDRAEGWRRLRGLFSNPHVIKKWFFILILYNTSTSQNPGQRQGFQHSCNSINGLGGHWSYSLASLREELGAAALQSQIQSNTITSSPGLNIVIDIVTNCKGMFSLPKWMRRSHSKPLLRVVSKLYFYMTFCLQFSKPKHRSLMCGSQTPQRG